MMDAYKRRKRKKKERKKNSEKNYNFEPCFLYTPMSSLNCTIEEDRGHNIKIKWHNNCERELQSNFKYQIKKRS